MNRIIQDWLGKRTSAVWIVGAGLLLRLLVLYHVSGTALFGDAAAYYRTALRMMAGESFAPVRAPGLPLWLALWQSLAGTGELAALISMLPFYPLLSTGVFLYARRLLNVSCANIALVLLAIYPAFVFHSVWPLTQLPVATLLVFSLLLLDRQNGPGPAAAASAGLLLGLTVLIRPNSISVPIVLAAAILLLYRSKGTGSAIILVLIALVPAGIMIYREYNRTGNLVFINYTNSMNLYLGNNAYTPLYKTWWFGSHRRGAREVPDSFSRERASIQNHPFSEQNRIYAGKAVEEITSRPGVFIIRTLSRIRCFLAFDTYTGTAAIQKFSAGNYRGVLVLWLDCLFYCLIVIAMLVFLLGGSTGEISGHSGLIIAAACLAYAAPFWIAFSHPTYHLPLLPLFAIPAAGAVNNTLRSPSSLKDAFVPRGLNWKLIATIVLFILIQLEWVYFMLPSLDASL